MPAPARGRVPTGPAAWQHQQANHTASAAEPTSHLHPPTGPRGAHFPQVPSIPASQSVVAVSTAAIAIPDPPAIPTFAHVPYFTAVQLETLHARRRGARMSASTWQTNRDIATGLIQSVASRLGFPQRTIATAQQIYQRFHLFYPPSDFVLHEIAVASLFVAAKLNDTHKKPRDLLLASYALRFPQLVKGGGATSAADAAASAQAADEPSFPTLAGQKRKHAATASSAVETSSPRPLAMAIGSVGEADIDPNILETDRKRLMALEKLILESLCFNFHSNANAALKMVIKLGRRSKLPKSFIRTAWKVAADLFRTSAPQQYPPNVIAVAALYAAALLARPPPRTTAPHSDQVQVEPASSDADDALVVFVDSIKSVSTSPAPAPTPASATSSTIPLSEPFPGCDPDCHVQVEDVEEAVHELLDLYLACTAQLPPSLYMSSTSVSSTAATPSPLSPADPLDAFNASPTSSGGLSDPSQPASARKKLKQYEYSPPPFGLVDWLNSARWMQLQQNTSKSAPQQGRVDPTAPTKQLSTLLTDLKIYLRGIEYDRQRADDAYLAQMGMVAETNVVPLPDSDPAAATSGLAQLMAAHSVTVDLRPLDPTPPKSSDQVLAALKDDQKRIVERIKRRKLATALRMTFVEPQVEKRPDASLEAVQKREEHRQALIKQQQKVAEAGVASDTVPVKKNRIEQAKRYLF